jgi:hypothetical protein
MSKHKRIICNWCNKPAAFEHLHVMGPSEYSCPEHHNSCRSCKPIVGNGYATDKYASIRGQGAE